MLELNLAAKPAGKKVVFYQENLTFCCGVNDIGEFAFENDDVWQDGNAVVTKSGTGMFTASFIDNEVCAAAYAQLTKEHKLLYQSPLRKNSNSGRQLFLCVFLHKDAK